ncbi:ornithine cyclodeaminase [Sphingosinicella ginsenosidimutans]|uniref:Ornithine cyclodeaminase family protein n=1 Tax=Allosphingosinicella ginsenosidimutans TaxID=1176539 RepID=A0A5C6TRN9_9SPHN|nr:ornithine cyclodeaminase family protein [Sphingosinicella ginsenosidimutans]TXC63023.1 ornithine cyclodeaminase family protein [Sphingosinicella ginsenosidimutans]
MSGPRVISAQEVERLLTYEACIPLMRDAMIALSRGRTRQLLRGILDIDGGNAFGVMPGAMLGGSFGAKLISIFPGNLARGGLSHQGVVALFDGETGAPRAFVDAGVLTAIRTAAASAAATDALARPDSRHLAIIGTGEQALRHIEAIRHVRPIDRVTIWGRDPAKAEALAARTGGTAAASVAEATTGADIICTVSGAADPILFSRDVADGAHVNAVGSSRAGPAEIASDLVVRARFFADHREGVLAQGAEFMRAREAGLVGDDHVLGEIGEVMTGSIPGRTGPDEVTLYKSLGSIVQDLAAADYVVGQAAQG